MKFVYLYRWKDCVLGLSMIQNENMKQDIQCVAYRYYYKNSNHILTNK